MICHSRLRQSSIFKTVYSQHSKYSRTRKHQRSLLALPLHQALDETCIRSIRECGCGQRAKASVSQLPYIPLHPSTRCPHRLSQGCWPGSRVSCNYIVTLLLHTGYRFPWTIPTLWRYASPRAICMICQFLMSWHYRLLDVAYQLQLPSITDRPLVDELQNIAVFIVWRYNCSVTFHVDDGFWRDV
jgi:hypothetical protein